MCIYCASVVPNTWITIDQSIAEAMLVDHVIFKNASDKSLPVQVLHVKQVHKMWPICCCC